MKGNYTAVLKKSGEWWIGWIEEVPGVNCQEPTGLSLAARRVRRCAGGSWPTR